MTSTTATGTAQALRSARTALRRPWPTGPATSGSPSLPSPLGTLMVFINQSIVLIAMPDIFRGIGLNPLTPGNTGYLLWMLLGFMVVLAAPDWSLWGGVGDIFGRVRVL